MNITEFRAAYWTDGQSDVLLTGQHQADLSDEQLLDEARREAARIGLEIGDGEIQIGDYRSA